ncbi:MAG: hypothetical protein QOH37_795, partial [Nocardioidaceae bacterium]|nr:hypothetical protein [Nocardioidaceae bacterium]
MDGTGGGEVAQAHTLSTVTVTDE